MATVAVLGLGLLGSQVAARLVEQGHEVRVWNRTSSKCAAAVAAGAMLCETPGDAVSGAERVHLVLRADDAVDEVIAALRPSLGRSVPVIDHSTNLPERVAARMAELSALGVVYVSAPVFMSPADARGASGIMLASGDAAVIQALRPELEAMTGQLREFPQAPDRAAVIKIMGNGLFIGLSALMGDLLRVGTGRGVDPQDAIDFFKGFAPNPGAIGKRVLRAGSAPASFELSMARKDVGLMLDTAGDLVVLPVVATRMDRAIEAGLGGEDFPVFVGLGT